MNVGACRISAGEEGFTTRGAYRTLAVRPGERGTIASKAVEHRSYSLGVSESANRVASLLIGAIPEDVRTLSTHVGSPSVGPPTVPQKPPS